MSTSLFLRVLWLSRLNEFTCIELALLASIHSYIRTYIVLHRNGLEVCEGAARLSTRSCAQSVRARTNGCTQYTEKFAAESQPSASQATRLSHCLVYGWMVLRRSSKAGG